MSVVIYRPPTADAENVGAPEFYASLGAEPKADKLFYRVEL
jgi:hypothetical protein